MTTPPSGPDRTDLQLLTELARSGEVGLPQAAWAVGIPQAEAAARLVRMAEAGLPLRLLAQGDPALLQQFLRSIPSPAPGHQNPPGTHQGPPSPNPRQERQQYSQYELHPQSGGHQVAPTSGAHQLGFPPAAAVEPEFAGPIGRPITPPADTSGPPVGDGAAGAAPPQPAAPSPQALWGIPGTASWTDRGGNDSAADGSGHGESDSETPRQDAWQSAAVVPRATPQATHEAATVESTQALLADSLPSSGGDPGVGSPQRTTGLSGEQVTVTVADVIDPGNAILVDAGYRLDDTERAVLVRTTIANAGPAPHDTMPDLYLFLVDATGRTLPKAPVAVAGHPAHRVGIAPGDTAEGWTIFLIDSQVTLSGVRWCIRPDLADRTLTWSV